MSWFRTGTLTRTAWLTTGPLLAPLCASDVYSIEGLHADTAFEAAIGSRGAGEKLIALGSQSLLGAFFREQRPGNMRDGADADLSGWPRPDKASEHIPIHGASSKPSVVLNLPSSGVVVRAFSTGSDHSRASEKVLPWMLEILDVPK